MASLIRQLGLTGLVVLFIPALVHTQVRGNGGAQRGLLVFAFAGALLAGVAAPGYAANVLCYKATSLMWDATRGRAVPVSPEIMERLARAFKLWEDASGGALRFQFVGHDAPGYDGTAQIPYDGCVHAVLYGERNFHGELAHGGFSGTIPAAYKSDG